jgi:hypothetical protein
VKGIEWFKIDQSLHNMNFQNTICFFFRYKEQKSEIKKQEQLKKEKEAKKKAKEEFKKNKLHRLTSVIAVMISWCYITIEVLERIFTFELYVRVHPCQNQLSNPMRD